GHNWCGGSSSYVLQSATATVTQQQPHVSNVNFSLVLGGSISGHVTDAQGQPIANFNIGANDSTGQGVGGTCTDANGNYTIGGIPRTTITLYVGGQNWCN